MAGHNSVTLYIHRQSDTAPVIKRLSLRDVVFVALLVVCGETCQNKFRGGLEQTRGVCFL